MNATPDLLPSIDLSQLHGGLAVAEAMNDEGEFETTIVRDLDHCTVADLKKAIAIQQREIAHAADGFQALTALLTRRLMQGARDADLALLPTEPNGVGFPSKEQVDAYLRKDQAAFDEWLATADFDALIDGALAAGNRALTQARTKPEAEHGFDTFACIALENRRSKILIQALQLRRMGSMDAVTYTYDLTIRDVAKRQIGHSVAHHAGVEAFALELSKPGFELEIITTQGS